MLADYFFSTFCSDDGWTTSGVFLGAYEDLKASISWRIILPSGPEPFPTSSILIPFSFAKVLAAGLANTLPPSSAFFYSLGLEDFLWDSAGAG